MKLQHNQVCQVAGWGVTEAGRGVADLRVVDVSVVDQNVCRRQWSGIPANVICAGGYQTLKGACNVSSLSTSGKFMNTYHVFFLYQNIEIFPFYRVILVVLWCATGWLLVLYLTEIKVAGTHVFQMSIQTCPSSVAGSTRLSGTMVVKCNNLTKKLALANLHCIQEV